MLEAEHQVLPVYSLVKPMIASLVFTNGIDLTARVSRWFDGSWVTRGGDITVGQLLNHTSGLCDYGHLPAYGAAIEAGRAPWSDEEFAEHTLRQPLLFEPGGGFAYSNAGYWLLREIACREAGLTFDALLHRDVTEPLGMGDTRVVQGQFADDLPAYGSGWVWHGLVVATALDMVRFMRSTLVAPLRQGLVAAGPPESPWVNPHYGRGLMVEPGVCYGHNGQGPGYGAACFHFEQPRLTGCVLTAARDLDAPPFAALSEPVARRAGEQQRRR